jgi:hypothetical protein
MSSINASEERGSLRFARTRRYTIYFVSTGVFITGILWLIYHYFLRTPGPFGFQNNPLEIWWLQLHGGFSFASLWIFGLLWSIHILRGWKMRWRRWSGGSLVAAALLLTITGWGLYYFDSREVREVTSIIHWVIGLISCGLFFLHWLSKSSAYAREMGRYPWPWHGKRHPQ